MSLADSSTFQLYNSVLSIKIHVVVVVVVNPTISPSRYIHSFINVINSCNYPSMRLKLLTMVWEIIGAAKCSFKSIRIPEENKYMRVNQHKTRTIITSVKPTRITLYGCIRTSGAVFSGYTTSSCWVTRFIICCRESTVPSRCTSTRWFRQSHCITIIARCTWPTIGQIYFVCFIIERSSRTSVCIFSICWTEMT